MTKLYIKETDKIEKIGNIFDNIKDLYEMVNDGEINPLTAILFLKTLEKKSKEYKLKIEDIAIDELSKHNGSIEMNGYSMSLKKSAGRWDFKHIEEIVEAENNLKQLKEKYKLAYHQIENNTTSVGEGGEVIKPAAFKHGKEIISIKKI
jgi:hypothetical protein